MVLVFDLDEEIHDPQLDGPSSAFGSIKHQLHAPARLNDVQSPAVSATEERANPNLDKGFSAILSCYPIVESLACHLDLNSLHDLSRTCRQFRANLLQYRTQLIAQSLRCTKENEGRGLTLADRLREARVAWTSHGVSSNGGRITSGKVGKCARDMVAECRRCDTIVCRNCTAKPPPVPFLSGRHRRLCRTCIRVPLSLLTAPIASLEFDEIVSPSSSPSTSPARLCRLPTPSVEDEVASVVAFTTPAFIREPCKCADTFWLCQPCGHSLRAADVDYARGWTWRGRYSTYLGGLGTGIGEGIEGVQCGRGQSCLAAKVIEQELDCDAEALQALKAEADKVASEGTGRSWQGTSFAVQEMEGVGGVVKKKVKRLVNVGAFVAECEDERDGQSKYLEREVKSKVRSWCAWCQRVIPSEKDLETPKQ